MTAQTDLYDQMVADIITLHKRPDLEEETELALRTATIAAHSIAAFPRDATLASIQIPNASYITAIDVQVGMPRCRGVSTVRLLSSDDLPVDSPAIEVVEMGDIYDPIYKSIRNDIAYLAGTSLNVRSSIPAYGYLVEYFQLPLVRREQYNSWIAMLAPDAIIYRAAAIVFGTNGKEEQSNKYMKMVQGPMGFDMQLISSYSTGAMR